MAAKSERKPLPTYDHQHERMLSDGYYVHEQSDSGSRYYVALNKPYVRVSDHAPNGPTKAWMVKNGVPDVRVRPLGEVAVEPLEEKEVGYHQHPAISRSMLADFLASPRLYEAKYVNKTIAAEDESLALMIGSFTHSEVLEPQLERRIKIIPNTVLSCNKNGVYAKTGQAWKEWEAANAGFVVFKEEEYATAMGCVDALRKAMWGHIESPLAVREHEIYWTHASTGLALRARLDILVKDDPDWWLPDLKTCADLNRFPNQIANSALWLQAAQYRAGVRAEFGRDAIFWFAVVEKSGTHRVWHYELDGEALAEADDRYERLLLDLKRRYDSGDWSEPQERGAIRITKRQCFGWEESRNE